MSTITVFIVSGDDNFAMTMENIMRKWGMDVVFPVRDDELCRPYGGDEVFIVDLRQDGNKGLAMLATVKKWRPEAGIILVNRLGNIQSSIAGMQAGAISELIVPFDIVSLKGAIFKAIKRRKKAAGKKWFLKRFGEVMAAATFAQAGEFDTAMELFEQRGKIKDYKE